MSAPAPKPHIVVHHLDDSRSQRILWLLEELEVSYEIKKYERTQQRRAPKELYEVHPLGKSPVIVDGDLTIAESGAIVEYIIEKYGTEKNKVKVGTPGWQDNLYFTHYAEGSVQPLLVRKLMFTMIPDNAPVLMQPVLNAVFSKLNAKLTDPELRSHAILIEKHLQKIKDTAGGKGWFAGGDDPTSADFMMSFTLEVFVERSPEYVGPLMREYVKRLQSRPAYKRAVEQGGQTKYLVKV
ncbi:thioredoxin-like protein [Panaeolus papilionaceus]|nr:thioredoxin-like protein [Panaeolus papilionaceus]